MTTTVNTESDYLQAMAIINALLEAFGDDESHPLAGVLDYLAVQIKAYEDEHFSIPAVEPREILHFLMEQHGLKQQDLGECAPQSRISEILTGKRAISKAYAKRFARRFNVSTDLFI